MTLTPTIGIQGGHQLLTLKDGAWLEDARIKTLFPASASEPSRALRAKPANPADLAGREALVVAQEQMVGALHKAGGRIIAGTDSPINPYGLSLLLELEHYVRGGLTPAEALRTATAVPAECRWGLARSWARSSREARRSRGGGRQPAREHQRRPEDADGDQGRRRVPDGGVAEGASGRHAVGCVSRGKPSAGRLRHAYGAERHL